ncbi:hypothetical protein [Polyangium mundeleinium]|uniref:Uncharacterized protein n=1 Tax=Polyangium mundeleinium TaxID=2995306 RepID=A0ABT5EN17_9BACT|nr:hypothetical protein [Polyangium mundeleinium]MDC0743228.1 hypothetical protein [Polyangium mundeleinium]
MAAEAAIYGVSLAQYAAIKAAVTEGFMLEDVLEVEGIEPSAFTRADLAWKQRIAGDQKLLDLYAEELAHAEDWLDRPVEPIGDDIGAWVSFLATLEAHVQPFELLKAQGLGVNDLSRLQRRWAARIDQEPALAKRIGELRKQDLRPVVEISVGLPVLRPSRMAPVRTKPSAEGVAPPSDRLVHDALKTENPVVAPPGNMSPDLHTTAPVVPVPHGPVMSFKPAGSEVMSTVVEPKPARAAASLTGTAPVLDLRRGAALPFADVAGKSDAPRALHALAETSLALDIPRGPVLPFVAGQGAAERGEEPGLDATRPVVIVPRGPALPFKEASPPAVASAPPPEPEAAPRGLAGTSVAVDVLRAPVMPFVAGTGPAKQGPTAPAAAGTPWVAGGLEQTSPVLALPRGDALPFAAAAPVGGCAEGTTSTAPMQERPRLLLTLEQHAALTLELALHPGQEAEVLARYSVTSEQKAQLDQQYREQVAASPGARAAWNKAYRAHYERLSRQRPPRR